MSIAVRNVSGNEGFTMARAHNKFTEEQMARLRENRYIRSVGEDMVFYTDECKRLCWQMYTVENLMPKEIMRRLGLDYHVLGSARVRGFMYNLKKQHERDGNSHSTDGAEQPKPRPKQTEKEKLERLRAENEYLKQELEFVKKIAVAGGEVKG